MNASSTTHECCPRFDPTPWNEREITWDNKPFVQDHVTSFFHIPLNFGAVMRRNLTRIEAAGAQAEQRIILADERSPWGSDVYLAVAKEVPGARMATLSGTFWSRVYEGPYRNMRKWIADMRQRAIAQGKTIKRLLFFYTTCPKCAKVHGKNYVVLLAEL